MRIPGASPAPPDLRGARWPSGGPWPGNPTPTGASRSVLCVRCAHACASATTEPVIPSPVAQLPASIVRQDNFPTNTDNTDIWDSMFLINNHGRGV